jgi:hypothetical protein
VAKRRRAGHGDSAPRGSEARRSIAHDATAFAEMPVSPTRLRSWYLPLCLSGLAALTLLLFGDVLVGPQNSVLSAPGTDIMAQFYGWREFGFEQLRHGNLALWNPHLFSGAPFFGGFQSALLYPLNGLYLLLPTAAALNLSIAIHVFLAGAFAYVWLVRKGAHPIAGLVGGAIFMFGGATFLHIYAGHLPNICTLAWTPLLLLSVDGLFESRSPKWVALGSAVVAMQILAGHPQYVYYTGMTVGLYSIMTVFGHSKRVPLLAGVAVMYVGAVGLTAVQIISGLDAMAESVRAGGVSYQFATLFSFPPENLITLAVPGLFGDTLRSPYWGRWFHWEMSIFIGASGVVLVALGTISGDRRQVRQALAMVACTLVLAAGAYTPLFGPMFQWLPGYSAFRGTAKFAAFSALFLAQLATMGADGVIRTRGPRRKAGLAVALWAGMLAAAGLAVFVAVGTDAAHSWWASALNAVSETRESYLQTATYLESDFIASSARFAATGLWIAAAITATVAVLVWQSGRHRIAGMALALMVVAEVFAFARLNRPTVDIADIVPDGLVQFVRQHPGNYRTLNLSNANAAMVVGAADVWGMDAGVPARYAEFMAWTQQANPDTVDQNLRITRVGSFFDMLRLRYVFHRSEVVAGTMDVDEGGNPMDQVLLVHDWQVAPGRDAVFLAMGKESFDPRRTVILETSPNLVQPSRRPGGESASIVSQGTDEMTIEAHVAEPAILLVTDAYSTGWRAVPLEGSSQTRYDVLPADYVLRGIPLAAGHHRLRLEYRPSHFAAGLWISAGFLLLHMLAGGIVWLNRSRRAQPEMVGAQQAGRARA